MRLGLILAAVVPAALLLLQIYRADRLEKEPIPLLLGLLLWGVVAAELAVLAEQAGIWILDRLFDPARSSGWVFGWESLRSLAPKSSALHDLLLYFGVVAVSEEGIKYLLLQNRTWRSPAFNCSFDGVVYGAFLSLGFALWENIHYVLIYGMTTALARAVTAVPGHACFGVFMGAWYGLAKRCSMRSRPSGSRLFRFLAFLIPTLLHGVYDFCAVSDYSRPGWLFLPFVAVMFLSSFLLVRHMARNDAFL